MQNHKSFDLPGVLVWHTDLDLAATGFLLPFDRAIVADTPLRQFERLAFQKRGQRLHNHVRVHRTARNVQIHWHDLVHRVDPVRAATQQALEESADVAAEIGTDAPGYVGVKVVESGCQLIPTAGDIVVRRMLSHEEWRMANRE